MGHALPLWLVLALLAPQSVTTTPFLILQNRRRGHRIADLRRINGWWPIFVGPVFLAILWMIFPREMIGLIA